VVEAENGAAAVELLRTRRFDLVLMDMQMPVMNGLEATAVLRLELGLTTPIIALTANAIKGEREKCLEAGMDDYLAKPFQEDELLKLIGDWVLESTNNDSIATPVVPSPVVSGDVSSPLYKLDLLHQVGQGDDAFVVLMLDSFIESCEEAVRDFTLALQARNLELLKAATHKLKPSLDHLHAHQALPLVEQLDAWEGEFDAEVLGPLIRAANELLEQIMQQMHVDLAVLAANKTS
jgi:CheY-like chemotaxis protein